MPTKTYVSVATNRLLGEQPTIVEDAIEYAILTGESIGEHILAANLSRIGHKVNEYLRYGRSTFVNGLPNAAASVQTIDEVALTAAINDFYGITTAEVVSVYVGSPTVATIVFQWLWENYFKVAGSNDLFDADGTTVLSQYVDFVDDGTNITINDDAGVLATLTSPTTYTGYYTVRWTATDVVGVTHYWAYDTSLNLYPDLNAAARTNYDSEFYPVIPIRNNKVSINNDTTTDEYTTSKRALEYLSVDLDDVISSVEESPDIDLIDDAFILLATNVYTQTPEEIEYLYRYFVDLARTSSTKTDFDYALDGSPVNGFDVDGNPTVQRITPKVVINDFVVVERDLNTEIEYKYITQATVAGAIGEVGTFTNHETILGATPTTTDADGNFAMRGYENSYITIRNQTTATTYEELQVHGLKHTTEVRTGGTYGSSDYRAKYVDVVLQNTAVGDDLTNNPFILPVASKILQEMSAETQEVVLYGSIHLVIYAIQKVHLEWYETELFGFFLKAIGIVLAIYTAGSSLLAAAAIGAKAVLLAIVKLTVLSAVVDYTTEWVFEELGDTLGFIAAISIALAAAYYGGGKNFFNATNAEFLMQAVTATTRVVSAYTTAGLKKLQEDYGDFQSLYEERLEELTKLQEGIEADGEISLLALLGKVDPYMNFNEGPQAFYNRTIHNGNPGVASLGMVDSYLTTALSLPAPDVPDILNHDITTLEDFTYE